MHKPVLQIYILHLFSPMANPKDVFESFDNLGFNLFETEDLFLKDDIDPDTNMLDNSKNLKN